MGLWVRSGGAVSVHPPWIHRLLLLVFVGLLPQLAETIQDTSNPCLGRPNGNIPDRRGCLFYIECLHQVAFSRRCPTGTYFSRVALKCDASSPSPCIQRINAIGSWQKQVTKSRVPSLGASPFEPLQLPRQEMSKPGFRGLFPDWSINMDSYTARPRPPATSHDDSRLRRLQLQLARGGKPYVELSRKDPTGRKTVVRVLIPWYLRIPLAAKARQQLTQRAPTTMRMPGSRFYPGEPSMGSGPVFSLSKGHLPPQIVAPPLVKGVSTPAPLKSDHFSLENLANEAHFSKLKEEADEDMRNWEMGILSGEGNPDNKLSSGKVGNLMDTYHYTPSPEFNLGSSVSDIKQSFYNSWGQANQEESGSIDKTMFNQLELYKRILGGRKQLDNPYYQQQHMPSAKTFSFSNPTVQVNKPLQPFSYNPPSYMSQSFSAGIHSLPGYVNNSSPVRSLYSRQGIKNTPYQEGTNLRHSQRKFPLYNAKHTQGRRQYTSSNMPAFLDILPPNHLTKPVIQGRKGLGSFPGFDSDMLGQIHFDYTDSRSTTSGASDKDLEKLRAADIAASYADYDQKPNSYDSGFPSQESTTDTSYLNHPDYTDEKYAADDIDGPHNGEESHSKKYSDFDDDIDYYPYLDSTYPSGESQTAKHGYAPRTTTQSPFFGRSHRTTTYPSPKGGSWGHSDSETYQDTKDNDPYSDYSEGGDGYDTDGNTDVKIGLLRAILRKLTSIKGKRSSFNYVQKKQEGSKRSAFQDGSHFYRPPYSSQSDHFTEPLYSGDNAGVSGLGKRHGSNDGEVQYDFTDNRQASLLQTVPVKTNDTDSYTFTGRRRRRSARSYANPYSHSSAKPKTYADHFYYTNTKNQSPQHTKAYPESQYHDSRGHFPRYQEAYSGKSFESPVYASGGYNNNAQRQQYATNRQESYQRARREYHDYQPQEYSLNSGKTSHSPVYSSEGYTNDYSARPQHSHHQESASNRHESYHPSSGEHGDYQPQRYSHGDTNRRVDHRGRQEYDTDRNDYHDSRDYNQGGHSQGSDRQAYNRNSQKQDRDSYDQSRDRKRRQNTKRDPYYQRGQAPRGDGKNGGGQKKRKDRKDKKDEPKKDGHHEHHGRKPPDFDNFPYTFLPKHLTGPLFSGDSMGFSGFGGSGGVSGFGGVKNVGLDDNGEVQYDFTDHRVASPSKVETGKTQSISDKISHRDQTRHSKGNSAKTVTKSRRKRSTRDVYSIHSSDKPQTYAAHLYYTRGQNQSPRERQTYQGNHVNQSPVHSVYRQNEEVYTKPRTSSHHQGDKYQPSSQSTHPYSTHSKKSKDPWQVTKMAYEQDYVPERYTSQKEAYRYHDRVTPDNSNNYVDAGLQLSSGHYHDNRKRHPHIEEEYSGRLNSGKTSHSPVYSRGYTNDYSARPQHSHHQESASSRHESYHPSSGEHGDYQPQRYSHRDTNTRVDHRGRQEYDTDRNDYHDSRDYNQGGYSQGSDRQAYNRNSQKQDRDSYDQSRDGKRRQNTKRDPYYQRGQAPRGHGKNGGGQKKRKDRKDKKDEPKKDGHHEHHGRKPPDFDNFPYTFLPKHLTGPLFSGDSMGFSGFGGSGGVSGFGGVKNVGLDDNGEVQYDFTDNRVASDQKPSDDGDSEKVTKDTAHTPGADQVKSPARGRSGRSRRSIHRDVHQDVYHVHHGTVPSGTTLSDRPYEHHSNNLRKKAKKEKGHAKSKKSFQYDPFGDRRTNSLSRSKKSADIDVFTFTEEMMTGPSSESKRIVSDFFGPKALHDHEYVETIYGFHDNRIPKVFNSHHDHGEPFSFRSGHGHGRRSGGGHGTLRRAVNIVYQRIRIEAGVARKMHNVIDSAPYRYVSAFLYAKPYAKYLSYAGATILQATRILKERYRGHPPSHLSLRPMLKPGIPDTRMEVPSEIDFCPYPTHYICDSHHKYRTIDGSCNNLVEPLWGRSMTPHRRLVPAVYGDGIDSMRHSVLGGPLPGPRHVSLHIFADVDRPSKLHTLLLMIWGQFIDHDLTRTAISMTSMDEKGFGQMAEVKCGFDGCDSHEPGLEACWPIPIPVDDHDFAFTNRCLKFVRSQEVPALHCKTGHRETLNQVTQWIDGSQIYGSTPEESSAIRDYSHPGRGWMSMTRHPHGPQWKDLLPQDDVELCRGTNHTIRCFRAGDERVNEQSGLTAMHTTWVRQHNRIEDELHRLNPHWDGERLYQETRRIVGALIQHIVFNEQLPLILGKDVIHRYGLQLEKDGFYHGYDPTYDTRISQAFGSAAYRFGHTLIQDRFRRSDYDYHSDDSLMLSLAFRRPVHMYDTGRGGVDSLLRGLCNFPAQTYDRFFTKQITRSLFTDHPPFGPGMDLLSLNIQRGRDHGIGSYNDYRQFCGLRRAKTFEDLSREITDSVSRAILRSLYKHVDDIDLFPGGIAERSVPGGVVGPTFGCIIANQLQHARKGDRFWYENDHHEGFTREQLREIRKMRLSRILCANGDFVDSIQPWAMLKPFRDVYSDLSHGAYNARGTGMSYDDFSKLFAEDFNARVPCSQLPDLDLRHWREGPYTH